MNNIYYYLRLLYQLSIIWLVSISVSSYFVWYWLSYPRIYVILSIMWLVCNLTLERPSSAYLIFSSNLR